MFQTGEEKKACWKCYDLRKAQLAEILRTVEAGDTSGREMTAYEEGKILTATTELMGENKS